MSFDQVKAKHESQQRSSRPSEADCSDGTFEWQTLDDKDILPRDDG